MSDERVAASSTGLRRKLLWLIGLRAATVTILLGSAVVVELRLPGAFPLEAFSLAIGVIYALTAVYSATVTLALEHRWLIGVQIVLDVLLVGLLAAFTGGVVSNFAWLYVLPIISGSILGSRRAGLAVAVLGAVGYAAIVAAQYGAVPGRLLVPVDATLPGPRVALYTVGLNAFGFVLVALLSGYLAESLRRADATLERVSSEIADLQAFHEHVIESMTSGLATTDPALRILTFNRSAESITGHPAAAVVGRRIIDALQIPWQFEGLLAAAADLRAPRVDYTFVHGDGRRVEIGLSATSLVTGAGPSGYLFTFQDVTVPKRLEREARVQQRLAAVGEMAAGIAHEIRNPLASISGSIQILRHEVPLNDEQARLMDIVLRESERLNATIRSFLAYARPERQTASQVDLRAIVRDVAMLLGNSAEVREHHDVVVDLPAAELYAEVDEGQIRQILWNLATNGLRAMPAGGLLEIGLAATATGVTLRVTDEGVGMPAEELDRIFHPFHGGFPHGTGLGLSIVHRIVHDHGGEIDVTSSVGAGTAVRVRLPLPISEVALAS